VGITWLSDDGFCESLSLFRDEDILQEEPPTDSYSLVHLTKKIILWKEYVIKIESEW
jgi:hypothetical protein